MFDLTHLFVYGAIAVLFYLLGVLGGRRSAKANAYADQLLAYGRRLEREIDDLRARHGDKEGGGQA